MLSILNIYKCCSTDDCSSWCFWLIPMVSIVICTKGFSHEITAFLCTYGANHILEWISYKQGLFLKNPGEAFMRWICHLNPSQHNLCHRQLEYLLIMCSNNL